MIKKTKTIQFGVINGKEVKLYKEKIKYKKGIIGLISKLIGSSFKLNVSVNGKNKKFYIERNSAFKFEQALKNDGVVFTSDSFNEVIDAAINKQGFIVLDKKNESYKKLKKSATPLTENLVDFNKNEIREAVEMQLVINNTRLTDKQQNEIFLSYQPNNKDLPVLELEPAQKITDKKTIYIDKKNIKCGVENDPSKQFSIDIATTTIKGSADNTALPKVMSEDGFVCETISVVLHGVNHHLPLMATLDGGGGHQLAQYTQEHLKTTFQQKLQEEINLSGNLNHEIINSALKKTDDILLSTGDPKGAAILHLNKEFLEIDKLGESSTPPKTHKDLSEKFKQFQKNPLEVHKILNSHKEEDKKISENWKKKNLSSSIEYGGKHYDLNEEADAGALMLLYTKSLGREERMGCYMTVNVAYINDKNNIVLCNYTRGDSQSVHSNNKGELIPLSKAIDRKGGTYVEFEGTVKNTSSAAVIADKSRVTSFCDGHREKISINTQEQFDKANLHLTSEEYTIKLMQASKYLGGGDDITIQSGQIKIGSWE